MRAGFIRYLCSSILCLALLSGCKQGEGDRCQVDSDCEEGLICCVTEGNRVSGGRCFTPAQCETAPEDGGITTDGLLLPDGGFNELGPADLGQDLAQAEDQGTPDTSPTPDTAPTPDISPTPDTAPTPDAAPSPDLPVEPDAGADSAGSGDAS